MPSIYLNVPKMETATRDRLVEGLYTAVAGVIKGPKIHTFVNEYEFLYENGKPHSGSEMTVVTLEAGPMPAEKIALIGGEMDKAVKAVLGESQGSTFVYHANQLDHLVINGQPLKK